MARVNRKAKNTDHRDDPWSGSRDLLTFLAANSKMHDKMMRSKLSRQSMKRSEIFEEAAEGSKE